MKFKTSELNEMSEKELRKLRARADYVLKRKNDKKNIDLNDQDISEISESIRKCASSRGVNRLVIFNALLRKMRVGQQLSEGVQKREMKIKFRNPHNHEETWTGHGQKPRWMIDMLERGHPMDSLKVENQ